MKPKAIQGKALSFAEVLAEGKKRAEEFDKLPPEEQAKKKAASEEILKKLRGTPGFTEIKL